MGYARELIPGGIWVASAITVAGYTWQAVTGNQTDSPLPAFGAGGDLGATIAAGDNIAGGGLAGNGPLGAFKVVRTAAALVGAIPGLGFVSHGIGAPKDTTSTYQGRGAGGGSNPVQSLHSAFTKKDKTAAVNIVRGLALWAERQPQMGGRGNWYAGEFLKANGLTNQYHALTGVWAGDLISGKTTMRGVGS